MSTSSSATSAELATLWKEFTTADGTSAVGAKAKEAVKTDFDALSKASEEIGQIIDGYRKVHLQLSDQWIALKQAAQDPRYTAKVPEPRRKAIAEAVAAYLQRVWDLEDKIEIPGYGNDLEEDAQKQTVEFDGKKRHADLLQKRLDDRKSEPKKIEPRFKNWNELREKAEKAYGEQKYERAFFYVVLLWLRMERQRTRWDKDSSPIQPSKLRDELVELWKWLLKVRGEVREARRKYDEALSILDQARKRLEQLSKTGVDEVARDLDLDPHPSSPPPPPPPPAAVKTADAV